MDFNFEAAFTDLQNAAEDLVALLDRWPLTFEQRAAKAKVEALIHGEVTAKPKETVLVA